MDATNKLDIMAELTPNPNTLKFRVHKQLLPKGSCNFPDKQAAGDSLLASRLFEIENVAGVMIGVDFVTVTKKPEASWNTLAEPIIQSLKTLLASGKSLLPADYAATSAPAEHHAANGEIEKRIKEILDAEIRPAVAMDGGDITFYGYDNGVVTLHLQGSCSSCPSSVLTLKMGVENRLKSLIPEVREVVQV